MAAVSFAIAVGGNLETVTQGTSAPAAVGTIEIRIDQTAAAVLDAAYPGGTRTVLKGESIALIDTLVQALIRSTAVLEP